MSRIVKCSDASEIGTSSGGRRHVGSPTESAAEKREIDEDYEGFVDSQEVQPKKKHRSTLNRISDSEDESDESFLEYSSSNSESDSEYGNHTDAEDRISNYKEPDPWHLHQKSSKNKKSTKTNKQSSSSASYDENQEVSIHKINLNHRDLSRKSPENVIKFIVSEYNKKRDNSRSETKGIFEERIVLQKPVVKPEDEKLFKGDLFHVKVYVQKVERTISLLNSFGIREMATTIHSLIFYYREAELFAITTNQAWNVVQGYSDFEFPHKIAARILSKDGESQSTTKALVGTELTRKTTHKQQKKTNPHDVLTLCTGYTAELRDNASILRLSCFQKGNAPNGNEENGEDVENGPDDEEQDKEKDTESTKPFNTIKAVKVNVSLGNIRIHRRLSTSDILSILSILSEISNDRETYDLNNKIELNSTAHKKYLTKVHIEMASKLNLRLSKIIHDAIADDSRMTELDNYQLCHKHASDFYMGYDFKLIDRNQIIRTFSESPTVKQIVVELRHNLGEVSGGTSDPDFLSRLNNVKLSYTYDNKEKKPEKLMNFIEGLLSDATDNSVFWHVMGQWCHVQDGYMHLVHNQFKKILNEYLLTDNADPAYLTIPWSNNSNVRSESKLQTYLDKFSNQESAWISERPERDIVDMIRIGKDRSGRNVFFVYYFLPDLNTKTNIKCNRVAESIMQIGKANMKTQNQNADVAGSEDVKVQLKDVYNKSSQKRQFKSICPNFKQFLEMMAEAKFYLAIGRDLSTVTATSIDIPSLVSEKEMSKEISCADIADILENLIDNQRYDDREMLKRTAESLNVQFDKCGAQRLAELIHRQLSEGEYIETDSNSIREKLLSVGRNNFGITGNRRVNQFLYDKIISKFQPRACTVLSKLGFIDFSQEISKLTIKSFNLIEMPLQ